MIKKMNSEIVELDTFVKRYLTIVFDEENGSQKEDLDEYLSEDFKFKSVNDWENSYDIVDYLEMPIYKLLDFESTCCAITIIQEYYEENYGSECLMDTKNLTPEKVLRNYAYVLYSSMDIAELKDLLFDEETKIYGPHGCLNRLLRIPLSVAFVSDELHDEEEEEEHPSHKFFEERDCAYCRVFFDQGKDNCKECGFDLNSWNKKN